METEPSLPTPKHLGAPLCRALVFAGLGALLPLGPQSTPKGLTPQEPARGLPRLPRLLS